MSNSAFTPTGVAAVNSVSNSDSTLTISPTSGAVVASLNVGNANTWTGKQTFSGAPPAIPTFSVAGFIINDASGNLSSELLTISKQFFLSAGANATYPLDSGAGFAYTITKLKSAAVATGSISAAIQINSVNVTNLSAVSITGVAADTSATGANTVAVGNRVTVVLSSNSSATNVEFTLVATRNS